MDEIKALHQENEKLKNKLAKDALGDVMDQVVDVNGVKLLAVNVADVDMNGLMNLGDQLKAKLGEGVIVLASVLDGAKCHCSPWPRMRLCKRRTCRQSDKGYCKICGRRWRRTPEYGPGRR